LAAGARTIQRPMMVLTDSTLKFLKIQMMRKMRMVRSSTIRDTAVSLGTMLPHVLLKEQPHVPCS
jgi:hypothetical protein